MDLFGSQPSSLLKIKNIGYHCVYAVDGTIIIYEGALCSRTGILYTLVHGAWSMDLGPWSMVHGPWPMDHCPWTPALGPWLVAWLIAHCPWPRASVVTFPRRTL